MILLIFGVSRRTADKRDNWDRIGHGGEMSGWSVVGHGAETVGVAGAGPVAVVRWSE